MDVRLDLLSPRFSSLYNLVKANLTSTSFPNLDLLAVRCSVRNAPKKALADLDEAVVGYEEEMSDLGEFNE